MVVRRLPRGKVIRRAMLIRGAGGFGGVVAAAGAHGELSRIAWRHDLDLDCAEGTVFGYVGGIVAQGVLVADVVGDLGADLVEFG